MPQASDYSKVPKHPLKDVPQEALDQFRNYFRIIRDQTHDIQVEDDMLEPVADAVFMEALEVIEKYWVWRPYSVVT